jgi:hypothetical protein
MKKQSGRACAAATYDLVPPVSRGPGMRYLARKSEMAVKMDAAKAVLNVGSVVRMQVRSARAGQASFHVCCCRKPRGNGLPALKSLQNDGRPDHWGLRRKGFNSAKATSAGTKLNELCIC